MAAITAEEMRELVARALAEDLGDGDVTGEATVPAEATASARIVQKAPGVVFGLDLVVETMAQTGVAEVDTLTAEGEWRQDVPAEVLVARGSARALLAATAAGARPPPPAAPPRGGQLGPPATAGRSPAPTRGSSTPARRPLA